MIHSLKNLVIFLASAAAIWAQADESTVRTDFRVLPILSADWTGILYQAEPEGEMVELDFRSLARSFDTYEYLGPEDLRFYRRDGTDEDGQPIFREVGRVKVTSSEMLVCFKANEGAENGTPEFSLLSMNDSPSAFPVDHMKFINLTRVPFGCRLMDEDLMLAPGVNPPISLSDKLNKNIFVGLVVQNENTQRVVLRNNWEFQPGNRHLILLLPPKKAGSFRIRAYRVTDYVGDDPRYSRALSSAHSTGLQ